MKITLHHDPSVAGIDILNVVSAAVNRLTNSVKLVGPEQAITPCEAFRTVTKDGVWQHFEEHRKGTLEIGKLADMVILSKDPLAVEPMTIDQFKVIETIKKGNTVFAAKADRRRRGEVAAVRMAAPCHGVPGDAAATARSAHNDARAQDWQPVALGTASAMRRLLDLAPWARKVGRVSISRLRRLSPA